MLLNARNCKKVIKGKKPLIEKKSTLKCPNHTSKTISLESICTKMSDTKCQLHKESFC